MRAIRWSTWALLGLALAAEAGVNSGSTRGPDGGLVTDIVFDPTDSAIAYAATQSSLYKSSDGGAIFTRLSAIPADANDDGPWGFALSADGATIYYSTLGRRFFRSTDGGASFSECPLMPSALGQLVVDPLNAAIVYAANGPARLKSSSGGVFRSEDSGQTWTRIHENAGTFDIAVDPLDSRRIYAAVDGALLISDDRGATFSPVASLPQATLGNPLAIAAPLAATDVASSVETVELRFVESLICPGHDPNQLLLACTAGSRFVEQGSAFSYLFRVGNGGPNVSTATRVSITVDPGATIVDAHVPRFGAAPTPCAVFGGTVDCNLGMLGFADPPLWVRVNATATATGTLRATAAVSPAPTAIDADASNNSATLEARSGAPTGSGGGGGSGRGGGSTSILLLAGLAWLAWRKRPAELRQWLASRRCSM